MIIEPWSEKKVLVQGPEINCEQSRILNPSNILGILISNYLSSFIDY